MAAQNWAPVGSKWYYTNWHYPAFTFTTIEVIGDTIIDGHDSRIIEGGCICGQIAPRFLYADSNRVFWYHQASQSFQLLYDFNKGKGESWSILFPRYGDGPLDTVQFTVDSVSNVLVNNDTLRMQHVRTSDPSVWIGEVIEGIGSNICLFPLNGVCGPGSGPLRCFESKETTYNFQDGIPCDSVIYWVGTSPSHEREPIRVFPNPTTDHITIEYEGGIRDGYFQLFSSTGQEVFSGKIDVERTYQLAVHYLMPGTYLLKIVDGGGRFYGSVFVKK